MEIISTNLFDSFYSAYKKNPEKEIIFFKEYKEYVAPTYQNLYSQIYNLAQFLLKNNISKNDHIAIILENSFHWPVSFFAIMRVGAISIPLNPQMEKEELHSLLKHSETKCILTSLNLYSRINDTAEGLGISIIAIDAEQTQLEIKTKPLLNIAKPEMSVDDIASIVYTSGTTAEPKGVLLTHKNLLSNLDSLTKLELINPDDCLISILPYYHSYPFMVNLLLPLITGAKISFPLYVEPQEIMDCIKKTGVTIFIGVPRIFSLFHQKIKKGINNLFFVKRLILKTILKISLILRISLGVNLAKFALSNLHSRFGNRLRFMISGGAKLNKDIAYDFYLWGFNMLQGYGLTETSPGASFSMPNKFKPDSVGKALPGVKVKINEPDTSGIGEIIIKGDNITQGYYKSENITNIAIKDGWFYSGDLGYIDKKGFIYIKNRKKELLVLSSGKKIIPDEIESFYDSSPYIEELCVFLTQDQENSKDILCAAILPNYITLRKEKITQVKDKIRWEIENNSRSLPSFKRIKKYIIINEKLPRTALGKLKRYLVREKYHIHWEEAKPNKELTSEEEMLLANPTCKKAYDYLCDKLNRTVYINDNLEIDLGLDSLEQIGLFLGFQEVTDVQFKEEDVFEIYTVKDILIALMKASNSPNQKEPEKKEEQKASLKEMLMMPANDQIKKSIILKQSFPQKSFNFILKCATSILAVVFFRLKVKGLKNLPLDGPLILCPNHASFLDAPLLFTALKQKDLSNTYFLGLKKYLENPALEWAKKTLRLIPIEARLDLTESLQKCAFVLKNSKILCIFGEGERTSDGTVKNFKKGIAILIKELNVGVIPVYIDGSFQAWSRHHKLPRPHKITITFGKKIEPQQLCQGAQDGVDIYANIVHNLREELTKLPSST